MYNGTTMIPVDVRQTCTGVDLNLEAICVWAATGFMLDRDTFFKDCFWDRPQTTPWYYNPTDITFDEAVDRFAKVFEEIVAEQVQDKKILLALSGGLDSRTLAAALHRLGKNPFAYSYKFEDGMKETKYGRLISEACGWDYTEYVIPNGYLWGKIDKLTDINQCYAEFTHARQMAVIDEVSQHGEIFLLGHLGDLLFDTMRVDDNLSGNELVEAVKKKILKKGGFELGNDLWQAFNLEGSFSDYLKDRIRGLAQQINIDNANAKIRAIKSMNWVARWTNVNLQIFSHYKPIYLPYYDERMCRFVCETPEAYLADRKIQIEYLKRYSPKIAKVPWQSSDPYNLFNHHLYTSWVNIPRRAVNKAKRVVNDKVFNKKLVMRNWEIQFLGDENDAQLREYLFGNEKLKKVIPESLITKYYNAFKQRDSVNYSHPVSMLLTFSVFINKFYQQK